MKIPSLGAVITLGLLLGIAPAGATIISTSPGVTVLGAPPPSTQWNQLQSNTDIFAFTERTAETLFLPIPVDATAPGSYSSFDDLSLTFLPAGLTVNSYLLHADIDVPLLPITTIPFLNRSITFAANERIVGIMVAMDTLRAADFFLGSEQTAYPPFPIFSGLELVGDPLDGPVVISDDLRTLSVNFNVSTGWDLGGVDQVRILTTVSDVPEPVTILLAGAGLLAIGCAQRLRRRA